MTDLNFDIAVLTPKIVAITQVDPEAKSLTNQAESVICALHEYLTFRGHPHGLSHRVYYRDTSGVWDMMLWEPARDATGCMAPRFVDFAEGDTKIIHAIKALIWAEMPL